MRGFQNITGSNAKLPTRKTANSAGYDIESITETSIHPNERVIVETGLKAFMNWDEVLCLFIRSSYAIKYGLRLSNCTGIIDSDYYNNEDNEGHILLEIVNEGDEIFFIHRGDRIAQGIFMKYLTVDDDNAKEKRTGGIGSTGK